MRFSIRDLLIWTAVAAFVALLFRLFPPEGALLACIPLAVLCFAMVRIAAGSSRTNWHAIAGCAAGALCGILAGVFTDLGLLYLQYRPGLPEWEFESRIGVMLGIPSGAFLGAVFGGLWGWIVALRKPPAT
jgi:hypothetical protein